MVETTRTERSVLLMKYPLMVARLWQSRSAPDPVPHRQPVAKVVLSLDPLLPLDNPNSIQFTMVMLGSEPGNAEYSLSGLVQGHCAHVHLLRNTSRQGRVDVEGKVEHMFDMNPNSYSIGDYKRLCRERTNKAMTKIHEIQDKKKTPPVKQ